MTPRLDSADKRIVLVSALALMLLTILALLFAPSGEGASVGFPSSYSPDPNGAKAAYTLLEEMGYRVTRWANPPEDLPKISKNTLLIIAGPIIPSSTEEGRELKQFVAGGGRLLITGMLGAAMIEAKSVVPAMAPSDEWQTFAAEVPAPLTRHAPEISMQFPAHWVQLGAGQLRYYGSEQGATVTKLRVGEGEIIWWGADSPLTNSGITKSSNLALFLNCLGSPSETRVLWDEYFHGVRAGFWQYVSRTPLPWGLAQLLILAAFVLITFGRRSGALRPLGHPSRLSPLEFVETVGALYQRKGAAAGALEIAYTRFRFLLARRLGTSSSVTTADLLKSVHERPGWTIPGFAQNMQQIEFAVRLQKVEEPQALAWVRKLYDVSHKLGLER
jgi:hypothetical protein